MTKKLTNAAFQEIRSWIYRNARPLDFALWQYHFENGRKETVLSILSHYQNNDGGFGNALDLDNWNPASTPYYVQFAIKILRQIDFVDTTHPIYQGIFRYLENTQHKADYGWLFTIASNNKHPHAVWWDYDPQTNIYQSIGVTAILSGFILRYGDKHSTLYQIATDYTYKLIEKLSSTTEFGDMGIRGYCILLEDMEAAGLTQTFDHRYLCEKVDDLVRNKIDTNDFMSNPLDIVLSSKSRFYETNKQEVEVALDQTIDKKPASGVWDIPWEWYNGNKYPHAFAISIHLEKSYFAIENLLQLHRFGRLDL